MDAISKAQRHAKTIGKLQYGEKQPRGWLAQKPFRLQAT